MQYLEREHESLSGFGHPHVVDDIVEVFEGKQSRTNTYTLIFRNYLNNIFEKSILKVQYELDCWNATWQKRSRTIWI